ncbi:diaminobutyrate--2-oxoglutarate transaminase [Acinetobacter haemolyticus]|uniref:Diaminobutyrate--2-oxoglutarate transaminase n=1 Tax=Acinetobacter haemolyticus TaxID=29430 RepID=A0AAW4J7F1_ACIHA|nr:diaminobutyrate--2-oxoglutarate transaminase [Acinetobacter haemolyticus]MBO3658897.1 diaminobutyrate--2-oxoglutarate transaminase [Acinetobacter haemolyticus]
MNIFSRLESEVRGYIHSFPTVFKTAKNAVLVDEMDRAYIDFLAGAGTLNYGHNHPVLKQAAIDYLVQDGIVHGLDMATSAKKAFIENFEQYILKPRRLNYKLQFTGPTGTNAVEAAIKLARNVTKRHNVIAFTNGFHGVSLGALALTGNQKFREAAGVALGNVHHAAYAGYFGPDVDTIDMLNKLLTDRSSGVDLPAAIIVECVQGEGGLNTASIDWLKRLSALCKQHKILLIVDDIQAGCGRSGHFFSFETAEINPDIVTLSKSLSGFGLPMSLVLFKPELDIWRPGQHNGTFRGHNLAFVTATKAIQHFWADQKFQTELVEKSALVHRRLQEIVQKFPTAELTHRGRGLMQGLAFKNPDWADEVTTHAFQLGLVIETSGSRGEVVKLLPPLTIENQTLEQGIDLLEQAIKHVVQVYSPSHSSQHKTKSNAKVQGVVS